MNITSTAEGLWRDVHHSLRTMARRPGATALTLLTIALGIGATTAIFSVVNGVLIRPLPYPEPERLVSVWHSVTAQGTVNSLNLSAPMYVLYREENETFEQFGVWSSGTASVTGIGNPEQVRTVSVTSEILPALGVQPALRRWFSAADDAPGTPETVVLTYGYWQRRLGGDPNVIGRVITVDSRPREVIGVMRQRFSFLTAAPDVVLPLRFDPNQLPRAEFFNYRGIARLEPGVTLAEANADLGRMLAIWMETWIERYGAPRQMLESAQFEPALRPLKRDVVGDIGNLLWVLMGTVGVVLLIACANVANLLLVKAAGRRQELAIRTALGAGWRRVARELLVESVTLGLLGGALGLGLAYGGLGVLTALGPTNLPRLAEISIDPTVLAFTLGVSLLSGLLFGAIPVVKSARSPIALDLRSGGPTGSQSRGRQLSQDTLVVAQVALALVVLVGSGLMLRSFQALLSVEPGFTDPEHLQMVRVSIPPAEVEEPERVIRMQNDILDRIEAIPGVTSAAFVTALPMETEFMSNMAVTVEGQALDRPFPWVPRAKFASPALFATQGTSLIAGRDFTWADIYGRRDVAIVSANMATEVWGEPSAALGKRLLGPGVVAWREVIGVVGDVYEDGAHVEPPRTVYWRAGVSADADGEGAVFSVRRDMTFAIRSDRAGTESLLSQVREAVWAVNPNLPLAQVRTLADVHERSMARTSFTLVMLGIAGTMALALGVIGIYGVISYAVSQRNREIGIRVAVGAQHRDVKRMFVRQGFELTCVGVIIGLAAAAGLTQLMSSLLFGVSALDWTTYFAVVLVLVGACIVASYLPARRALAVDPVQALKAE